jgi:hypothetical protein
MKYPKCQFENLNGMNFCGKCGAKLGREDEENLNDLSRVPL